MKHLVEPDRLLKTAAEDRELCYKLRGFSGTVRINLPNQVIDVRFDNGVAAAVEASADTVGAANSEPAVTWRADDYFWENALLPELKPGFENLLRGTMHGFSAEGDFVSVIAPWQGGWARLFLVLRMSVVGPAQRKPYTDPHRDTDTAVGRYEYVHANGLDARMYYEQAGTGPIPLMLQATAGADSRQYRHLLADPRMQQRFTMYAYDLPYHGRSLPPFGVRWWEEPYLPTRDVLMGWVLGLKHALGLQGAWFLGCSVGGQMALDFAAEHPDEFDAFIAVNGWYGAPTPPPGFSNDLFRTPEISSDYAPQLNFGSTAPFAPEPYAHETYWVYRSALPGVYAGDNDYFLYEHDLAWNGHKIDAVTKPVYVVAGEWDRAAHDEEVGGAAVAKKIPGARFVVLPDLGHFAPCDDPIAFGDAILPLLDEIGDRVHTQQRQ